MAQIPTTNIGMNLLQNEYGGNNPISMSEYYRKTANNGFVDNSSSTPAGYPYPISNEYPPGTNSSSGQNGSYVRQTYVNRYPYFYIPGTSTLLFGADSGQPIGPTPQGVQAQGSRFWYWGGSLVRSEAFNNYGSSNGPNSNNPTGNIGAYGQNIYNYYIPSSYINGPNGLWGSGFGGCQNPVPSDVSVSWPYESIGPYTGRSYGPLNNTGFFPILAMQSRVFYGLVRTVDTWFPGGTQYLNQTVPTSGTISLGDFKNQQN